MKTNFDFMKRRHYAVAFSVSLVIFSLLSLVFKGLNFGLDFTGGTSIEITYQHPVKLDDIRSVLKGAKFHDAIVQYYGTESDVLIRLAGDDAKVGERILQLLKEKSGDEIELKSVAVVGPQVGKELRDQGGLGLLAALGLVFCYIAYRFQFKFAVGAILALLHDPIIVIGAFSFFGWQFDLNVLAALLAIIGYSVNDTIVVDDRIRENFRKLRTMPTVDIIDISLNETLTRTINTSLVTWLSMLALLLFGGPTIHGFATAMSIGIIIGTYSSVYVAAALLVYLKATKEDLTPATQEDIDDRP